MNIVTGVVNISGLGLEVSLDVRGVVVVIVIVRGVMVVEVMTVFSCRTVELCCDLPLY